MARVPSFQAFCRDYSSLQESGRNVPALGNEEAMTRNFDALNRSGSPPDSHSGEKRTASPSGSAPAETVWLDQVQSERLRLTDQSRIVSNGTRHLLGADRYRMLAARLSRWPQSKPLRTLLVTSAVSAEGKTVSAINLAIALARTAGRRVLLIDGDLRSAGLTRLLGVSLSPGLAEFLQGQDDLGTVVRRLEPLGVYFIPSGRRTNSPMDLLELPALRQLFAEKVAEFDWVVVDSVPLGNLPDTQPFAELVSGILLVVRAGRAPRDLITHALQSIRPEQFLGVVLNGAVAPGEQYYYHYYSDGASRTGSRDAGKR